MREALETGFREYYHLPPSAPGQLVQLSAQATEEWGARVIAIEYPDTSSTPSADRRVLVTVKPGVKGDSLLLALLRKQVTVPPVVLTPLRQLALEKAAYLLLAAGGVDSSLEPSGVPPVSPEPRAPPAAGGGAAPEEDAGRCVTGETLLPLIRADVARSWPAPAIGPGELEAGNKTGAQRLAPSSQPTLVQIVAVQPGDYVLSLNEETQQIEPHRIKGLLDMGIKPVFRLTTASGRSITTTATHPYLTQAGWRKVSGLSVGEAIAVPKPSAIDVAAMADFGNQNAVNVPVEDHAVVADLKPIGRGGTAHDRFGKVQRMGLGQIVFDFVQDAALKIAGQFHELPLSEASEVIPDHPMPSRFLMTAPELRPERRDRSSEAKNAGDEASISSSNSSSASASRNMPTERAPLSTTRTTPFKCFEGWARKDVNETTSSPSNVAAFMGSPSSVAIPATAKYSTPSEPMPTDVLWDRIVAIEPSGRQHVYDIEVEGTHNFIGNGIVAHNTFISQPSAPSPQLAAGGSAPAAPNFSSEGERRGFTGSMDQPESEGDYHPDDARPAAVVQDLLPPELLSRLSSADLALLQRMLEQFRVVIRAAGPQKGTQQVVEVAARFLLADLTRDATLIELLRAGIVDHHDAEPLVGWLEAERRTINMPLTGGPSSVASGTPTDRALESSKPRTTPRMLLAEDNEDARQILSEFFTRRGYEVVAVSDGAEALAEALRQPFDVIVSDQRMPNMTGLQFISELRKQRAQPVPPTFLVTAEVTPEVTSRANELRTTVVSKRESLDAIAARVAQTLAALPVAPNPVAGGTPDDSELRTPHSELDSAPAAPAEGQQVKGRRWKVEGGSDPLRPSAVDLPPQIPGGAPMAEEQDQRRQALAEIDALIGKVRRGERDDETLSRAISTEQIHRLIPGARGGMDLPAEPSGGPAAPMSDDAESGKAVVATVLYGDKPGQWIEQDVETVVTNFESRVVVPQDAEERSRVRYLLRRLHYATLENRSAMPKLIEQFATAVEFYRAADGHLAVRPKSDMTQPAAAVPTENLFAQLSEREQGRIMASVDAVLRGVGLSSDEPTSLPLKLSIAELLTEFYEERALAEDTEAAVERVIRSASPHVSAVQIGRALEQTLETLALLRTDRVVTATSQRAVPVQDVSDSPHVPAADAAHARQQLALAAVEDAGALASEQQLLVNSLVALAGTYGIAEPDARPVMTEAVNAAPTFQNPSVATNFIAQRLWALSYDQAKTIAERLLSITRGEAGGSVPPQAGLPRPADSVGGAPERSWKLLPEQELIWRDIQNLLQGVLGVKQQQLDQIPVSARPQIVEIVERHNTRERSGDGRAVLQAGSAELQEHLRRYLSRQPRDDQRRALDAIITQLAALSNVPAAIAGAAPPPAAAPILPETTLTETTIVNRASFPWLPSGRNLIQVADIVTHDAFRTKYPYLVDSQGQLRDGVVVRGYPIDPHTAKPSASKTMLALNDSVEIASEVTFDNTVPVLRQQVQGRTLTWRRAIVVMSDALSIIAEPFWDHSTSPAMLDVKVHVYTRGRATWGQSLFQGIVVGLVDAATNQPVGTPQALDDLGLALFRKLDDPTKEYRLTFAPPQQAQHAAAPTEIAAPAPAQSVGAEGLPEGPEVRGGSSAESRSVRGKQPQEGPSGAPERLIDLVVPVGRDFTPMQLTYSQGLFVLSRLLNNDQSGALRVIAADPETGPTRKPYIWKDLQGEPMLVSKQNDRLQGLPTSDDGSFFVLSDAGAVILVQAGVAAFASLPTVSDESLRRLLEPQGVSRGPVRSYASVGVEDPTAYITDQPVGPEAVFPGAAPKPGLTVRQAIDALPNGARVPVHQVSLGPLLLTKEQLPSYLGKGLTYRDGQWYLTPDAAATEATPAAPEMTELQRAALQAQTPRIYDIWRVPQALRPIIEQLAQSAAGRKNPDLVRGIFSRLALGKFQLDEIPPLLTDPGIERRLTPEESDDLLAQWTAAAPATSSEQPRPRVLVVHPGGFNIPDWSAVEKTHDVTRVDTVEAAVAMLRQQPGTFDGVLIGPASQQAGLGLEIVQGDLAQIIQRTDPGAKPTIVATNAPLADTVRLQEVIRELPERGPIRGGAPVENPSPESLTSAHPPEHAAEVAGMPAAHVDIVSYTRGLLWEPHSPLAFEGAVNRLMNDGFSRRDAEEALWKSKEEEWQLLQKHEVTHIFEQLVDERLDPSERLRPEGARAHIEALLKSDPRSPFAETAPDVARVLVSYYLYRHSLLFGVGGARTLAPIFGGAHLPDARLPGNPTRPQTDSLTGQPDAPNEQRDRSTLRPQIPGVTAPPMEERRLPGLYDQKPIDAAGHGLPGPVYPTPPSEPTIDQVLSRPPVAATAEPVAKEATVEEALAAAALQQDASGVLITLKWVNVPLQAGPSYTIVPERPLRYIVQIPQALQSESLSEKGLGLLERLVNGNEFPEAIRHRFEPLARRYHVPIKEDLKRQEWIERLSDPALSPEEKAAARLMLRGLGVASAVELTPKNTGSSVEELLRDPLLRREGLVKGYDDEGRAMLAGQASLYVFDPINNERQPVDRTASLTLGQRLGVLQGDLSLQDARDSGRFIVLQPFDPTQVLQEIFIEGDGTAVGPALGAAAQLGFLQLFTPTHRRVTAGEMKAYLRETKGYAHVNDYVHAPMRYFASVGWVTREGNSFTADGSSNGDHIIYTATDEGLMAFRLAMEYPTHFQALFRFLPAVIWLDEYFLSRPRDPPRDAVLTTYRELINAAVEGFPKERNATARQVERHFVGELMTPTLVTLKAIFLKHPKLSKPVSLIDELVRRGRVDLSTIQAELTSEGYTAMLADGTDVPLKLDVEFLSEAFRLMSDPRLQWAALSTSQQGHTIVRFTPAGAEAVRLAWTPGVFVSYYPQRARFIDLLTTEGTEDHPLFATLFPRDAQGRETNLRRPVNAYATGENHKKRYYRDILQRTTPKFNGDLDAQPRLHVDIGTSNGELALEQYQRIMADTDRGRRLKEHPEDPRNQILLVLVDLNEEALNVAEQTLLNGGVPRHQYIRVIGDIKDPVQMERNIREAIARHVAAHPEYFGTTEGKYFEPKQDDRGEIIPDAQGRPQYTKGWTDIGMADGLETATFLIHNRPWVEVEDRAGIARWRTITGSIDHEIILHPVTGRLISVLEHDQQLFEFLKLWKPFLSLHGFITAELSSVNPPKLASNQGRINGVGNDAPHVESNQFTRDIRAVKNVAYAAGYDVETIAEYPRNSEPNISILEFKTRPDGTKAVATLPSSGTVPSAAPKPTMGRDDMTGETASLDSGDKSLLEVAEKRGLEDGQGKALNADHPAMQDAVIARMPGTGQLFTKEQVHSFFDQTDPRWIVVDLQALVSGIDDGESAIAALASMESQLRLPEANGRVGKDHRGVNFILTYDPTMPEAEREAVLNRPIDVGGERVQLRELFGKRKFTREEAVVEIPKLGGRVVVVRGAPNVSGARVIWTAVTLAAGGGQLPPFVKQEQDRSFVVTQADELPDGVEEDLRLLLASRRRGG
ncbi:MAG: response regulator [Candidatus Omnitrophica bacterium]|nr:response regulator [Candidatus Omnitrophota bacterium]